jgi:hypothetical protein
VEIDEIHVIRLKRLAKLDTQFKKHVIVAWIKWSVVIELDCDIDITRCMGRFGGVGAKENHKPDWMLPKHTLEGVKIESGRPSDFHDYCVYS